MGITLSLFLLPSLRSFVPSYHAVFLHTCVPSYLAFFCTVLRSSVLCSFLHTVLSFVPCCVPSYPTFFRTGLCSFVLLFCTLLHPKRSCSSAKSMSKALSIRVRQLFGALDCQVRRGSIEIRWYCPAVNGVQGLEALAQKDSFTLGGEYKIKREEVRIPRPGQNIWAGFEPKEASDCKMAPGEEFAPMQDVVVDIVKECEALGMSLKKTCFLQQLGARLPDAVLLIESVDPSLLGVCWIDKISLIIGESDQGATITTFMSDGPHHQHFEAEDLPDKVVEQFALAYEQLNQK
ncbi:hypothetical protein QOT17_010760 [Balamuthia mandrillaris]